MKLVQACIGLPFLETPKISSTQFRYWWIKEPTFESLIHEITNFKDHTDDKVEKSILNYLLNLLVEILHDNPVKPQLHGIVTSKITSPCGILECHSKADFKGISFIQYSMVQPPPHEEVSITARGKVLDLF